MDGYIKKIDLEQKLIKVSFYPAIVKRVLECMPTEKVKEDKCAKWNIEIKHYYDDWGDIVVYSIAHCSNCGSPHSEVNNSVCSMTIKRPDDLSNDEEWIPDLSKIYMNIEKATKDKLMKIRNYCFKCGCRFEQ